VIVISFNERKKEGEKTQEKPVSLHPLGFEEAVSDLLKVKPKGKKRKRRRKSSGRQQ